MNNLEKIIKKTTLEKNKLRARIDANKSKKLTKILANTNSKYIAVLELEKEMKEVQAKLLKYLEEQREIASLFEDIDSLEKIKKGQKNNIHFPKTSRRFYSLQEVFSQTEDYYMIIKEGKIDYDYENALIEKIIIHPENISDDLLLNLGIEKESFKKLQYHEKLSRKIDAVKRLKSIFSSTIPLNIGGESTEYTGRIMTCTKRGDNSFGDIILIQNIESPDGSSESIKKTISVHDNVYSFLRAQFHTQDSILEKEKNLRRIHDILKSTTFGIQKNTKTSIDISISIISNQIKSLKKYRGIDIMNAITELTSVDGKNIKNDTKRIENALLHIEKKERKSISQRTNISKQVQNIQNLTHNSEKSWSYLKKNFKDLIRIIERSNPSKLVKKFQILEEGFKKGFSGVNEELIFEVTHAVEIILSLDFDEEAKTEAYFWSKKDNEKGIDTSKKEYQDHQYFEALKQKKDYFSSIIDNKKGELDFLISSNKVSHIKDVIHTKEKIRNLLKVFLDSRSDFCPYPYSYVYDNVAYEKKRLAASMASNNTIDSFRSLLSLLMTIKEYDVLIFLSKLEGNKEINKIDEDEDIRKKYIHAINAKISSLVKKDFLKEIDFPTYGTINKKFLDYMKILNTVKVFIEKGKSEALIEYIKSLKLKKEVI